MSFFNRMLASVGIGSAQVNTRLAKAQIQVGEIVQGVAYIEGGQLDQQIDEIYLYLMTHYAQEVDDSTVNKEAVIQQVRLSQPFTLRAGEKREVPFSFVLPGETPISMGKTRVWLKTGLDIKMAVNPKDKDHIEVLPHPITGTVLRALDLLGFRLREVECQYAPRLGRHQPFVQEFEFVPTRQFRGELDELEVIFFTEPDQVEVLIQIDRRAQGLIDLLNEAMEMDERFVHLRIHESDASMGAQALSEQLAQTIRRYL